MISKYDILAFGSPDNLDKDIEKQKLLSKIIYEENFIFSCLDYGNSLNIISNIVKSDRLNLKLICKIYLNYPDLFSVRKSSLTDQIKKIKDLFLGENIELVPQISSIWHLPKNGYEKFISNLFYNFGINRIIIEIYPDTNSKCLIFADKLSQAISKLNLTNKFSIGFISYEDKIQYGFDPKLINYINKNNLEISLLKLISSVKTNEETLNSFRRIYEFYSYQKFFRAVVKVSSQSHYNYLIDQSKILIKNIKNQKNLLLIKEESYYYRKLAINPYGLNKFNLNVLGLVKKIIRFFLKKDNQNLFIFIKKIFPTNF